MNKIIKLSFITKLFYVMSVVMLCKVGVVLCDDTTFFDGYNITTDQTITIDTQRIITNTITTNSAHLYRYSISEPCMIEVQLENLTNTDTVAYDLEFDILTSVNNVLASNTSSGDGQYKFNRYDSFYFNFVSGNCYFFITNANTRSVQYKLTVKKHQYHSLPAFYLKQPVQNTIFSEFDIITPKVMFFNPTGSGYTNSSLVINGYNQSDNNQYLLTSNDFVEYTYGTRDISNYLTGTDKSDSSIIIYTDSTILKGHSQVMFVPIAFDFEKPTYESINANVFANAVEVEIVGAKDQIKLADKPYRYKIYNSNSTEPAYTNWISNPVYFSEFDVENGNYIIKCQIRDSVAEKYENDTSKDLSNHIVTYETTVTHN